jgi:Undecaprenyl-phosphate glucose phosphotransferase
MVFLISLPLFYLHNYFSRGFILIYFGLSFTGFVLLRIVVRYLLSIIRARGYNARHLLIVGGGSLAGMVLDKVTRHPEFGYTDPIVVTDKVEIEALRPLVRGVINDLSRIIREFSIDDVIVAYPLSRENEIVDIVNSCEMVGVRVRIVPDFFGLIHNRVMIEDLDNLPLLSLQAEPLLSLWNRTVKRVFDIVFATVALLLLSPLFLVLAILIKATSQGPVFFAQERIGMNNRRFNLYKFRSMRVQSKQESDTIWTTQNDTRVTPLGRFMRKTNIDELPQFYNVLIGNMSVVGPRPEREYFADRFAGQIRAYRIRHLVRGGITGWAQVNGLRGDTSITERLKYDMYYIENWTILLDIKIIVMTVLGKSSNAM